MTITPAAKRPQAQQWIVDARHEGQRIDNFLVAQLKSVPKSHVYRILRTGQVRVNRKRIKPQYRLQVQDEIRIPPLRVEERPAAPVPPKALCQRVMRAVLFDEAGMLVLDKPAGLAVHGGSGLSFGVIEVLRAVLPQASSLELVHRLDRDTSGCLMVARKRSVLRSLHEQLRAERGVDKRYVALLVGNLSKPRCRVDAGLKKNVLHSGERVVRVDDEAGRDSVTEFRVLERFGVATLVEAVPVTGRTHQIRVHAAHLGHAVAGDTKYGDEQVNQQLRQHGLKRLFLHAAELRFALPDRPAPVHVTAPLPAELETVLASLRRIKPAARGT
jgi:23S rRNA pseudouridine955/2504/2580 synthase